MISIIQEPVECLSAEEFLDALSPIGKYFKEEANLPWFFRGQGVDAPLIPSAFRNKHEKMQRLAGRIINNFPQFRLAERDIIIQFFEIADKRGLILPDDTQELRSELSKLKSNDHGVESGGEWSITNKALSLLALAQHYGMPTRLLDWTRNAYISAYFAAEDVTRKNDKPSKNEEIFKRQAVVWAFCFPDFDKYNETPAYPLRIVTAPSATNTNLKAQQGVFTLINSFYETEANYVSLDKFLQNLAKKASPEHSDQDKLIVSCRFRKFTLRKDQAPQLLRLLGKLDITPSAIYPGYHSILSDLQMRNILDGA